MAKSKESYSKREKEKQRLKQQEEKKEKKEQRKANASKGKSLEDMMAYIDENGNISSTPPDESKKKVFNVEDIEIGVPKHTEEESDEPGRKGVVSYFNESKGFGFISDQATGERVFFHVNNLQERISENDQVTFETEKGPRGPNAINVKKKTS
ncbi:cold shock domain-containing protein [Paraflavisolibacter sp. H34]|uniref:cold-shock protein n=1 Tax=Huijunlia imazamoxiresistens TaxID=3127457 RepID=UPI00301AC1DA